MEPAQHVSGSSCMAAWAQSEVLASALMVQGHVNVLSNLLSMAKHFHPPSKKNLRISLLY
jgi:hypothetical protein